MLILKNENVIPFTDYIIRGSLSEINGENLLDEEDIGIPEKKYNMLQKEIMMKIDSDFPQEDGSYMFSDDQLEDLMKHCITNLIEIAMLDLVEMGKVEMTVSDEGEFLFRKI